MPIDKELYRQARRWYQEWNRAEAIARARNAMNLTPQQRWDQFVDLWEFGWQMRRPTSGWARQEKLETLDRYYKRVQALESWRRTRGRAP